MSLENLLRIPNIKICKLYKLLLSMYKMLLALITKESSMVKKMRKKSVEGYKIKQRIIILSINVVSIWGKKKQEKKMNSNTIIMKITNVSININITLMLSSLYAHPPVGLVCPYVFSVLSPNTGCVHSPL